MGLPTLALLTKEENLQMEIAASEKREYYRAIFWPSLARERSIYISKTIFSFYWKPHFEKKAEIARL